MTRPGTRCIAACAIAYCPLAVLACLAVLLGSVYAQAGKTVTIRIFDARTAQPIVPSNLLVRFDHQEAIRNETLRIDADGVGQVTIPAGTSFVSVQGTYDNSMEIYINCDAGMEKNTGTVHWYPLANILSTGVIAPNECYHGKYERDPRIPAKPGELDVFVRKTGFHEQISN